MYIRKPFQYRIPDITMNICNEFESIFFEIDQNLPKLLLMRYIQFGYKLSDFVDH